MFKRSAHLIAFWGLKNHCRDKRVNFVYGIVSVLEFWTGLKIKSIFRMKYFAIFPVGQILKKVLVRVFEKEEEGFFHFLFNFFQDGHHFKISGKVLSLFKDTFKIKNKLDKRTEHIVSFSFVLSTMNSFRCIRNMQVG